MFVLLMMAAVTLSVYFKGRLFLFRLLVSYKLWKTIAFAVAVIMFPAVVLAGWEWLNLPELTLPHHSGETGWHVLSVYFNAIYPSIPPLNGAELKITHILFFAAGVLGYLLISGVMLSLFVNVLQNKVKNIEQGDEPCVPLRNHLVVFGRGSMPLVFLKNVLQEEQGEHSRCPAWWKSRFAPPGKIVVVTEDSVPTLRELMKRDLHEGVLERIVFVHGARNSEPLLKTLSLPGCREIVMLGDPVHPGTDDINIETVTLISKVMKTAKSVPSSKKRCRVYFERYSVYTLFSEMLQGEYCGMYIDPQCSYKTWADIVLCATGSSSHYRPLDYRPLTPDSADAVHLVIIGMSRMGLALAAEAVQLLHFPGYTDGSPRVTRITMIDAAARREMERWKLLNNEFFRECTHTYTEADAVGNLILRSRYAGRLDVEINFIQAAAESPQVMALLEQYGNEKNALLTVAVCLPDPRDSLTVGLNLPVSVYGDDDQGECSGANILIQQDLSNGMSEMLVGYKKRHRYRHVRTFGMSDSPLGFYSESDAAARMLAALYKAHFSCSYMTEEELEDNATAVWRNQSEVWYVNQNWESLFSLRCEAASRYLKLRSLGLTQEEVLVLNKEGTAVPQELRDRVKQLLWQHEDVLAETEHRRWSVGKLMMGYASVPRECWEAASLHEKKAMKQNFRHGDICCSYEELSYVSREYHRFISRFLYCLLPWVTETPAPKEK